jgi:predicted nucleotidyltransferase
MSNSVNVSERIEYSKRRLVELKERLHALPELVDFPGLTVFGAGSYARLEAGEYSDIDLFFMSKIAKANVPKIRTKKFRMFGRIIDVTSGMSFPPFSNDCEYLVVLHSNEMLEHLGSRTDDHENYFTARMLLLLESHCLFGQSVYDELIQSVVQWYFRDYSDHAHSFKPVFLLNDICRFWKTMLLNYENKRTQRLDEHSPEAVQRRTEQKVRNFKLKYSRMTTCFASVAALGSYKAPVTEDQVLQLTRLTPRERLESVKHRIPGTGGLVDDLLARYSGFLELTALPTHELQARITDKELGPKLFDGATEYGDVMFQLLQMIDNTTPQLRLIRTLVI